MARGQGKGSSFEREICKALGLWWTAGDRDDIFWRSSNSGGRAKVRSKKGKRTAGQYGDICATDPIGQLLINLVAIECKRGYRESSIGNMLDVRPHRKNNQPWMAFYEQVRIDQGHGNRPYWILITKRDSQEIMIQMPLALFREINDNIPSGLPDLEFGACVSAKFRFTANGERVRVFVTPLSEFFRIVSREVFVAIGTKLGIT